MMRAVELPSEETQEYEDAVAKVLKDQWSLSLATVGEEANGRYSFLCGVWFFLGLKLPEISPPKRIELIRCLSRALS